MFKKNSDQRKYISETSNAVPGTEPPAPENHDKTSKHPACPECGSKNTTGTEKPSRVLLGCLLNLLMPFFSFAVIDADKIYYTCPDCGFEWYSGYKEDAAIKDATKTDQRAGCLIIIFLLLAVVLYLALK